MANTERKFRTARKLGQISTENVVGLDLTKLGKITPRTCRYTNATKPDTFIDGEHYASQHTILYSEKLREKKGGLLWPIARKKNSTSVRSAAFVTIFVCTLVQARKFHVHYFAAIFFKILDNPEITDYMKEDHRSYTHNFCSCEKKKPEKIQACTGFESLTSAIPVPAALYKSNEPGR